MGYPPDNALILIGVMPHPRDMDIARLLGWYRIPFRTAPKVVDVDFVAFYQPSSFGEQQRWQIRHYAPVRGHELTTRGELLRSEPDHPRYHEEYYKLQLGPLETLPEAIQAEGWRRVTFLYTTGELFRQAETVSDLVVRSEERQLLWRSLRERAMRAGAYQPEELPEEVVDAAIQAMLGDFSKLAEGAGSWEMDADSAVYE